MKMSIERYATGDNWHEPYVSGHDNVWEMIVEDMDKRPYAYEEEEKALFDIDYLTMTKDQQKRLREYIENWI
jgi:hypothetical protein